MTSLDWSIDPSRPSGIDGSGVRQDDDAECVRRRDRPSMLQLPCPTCAKLEFEATWWWFRLGSLLFFHQMGWLHISTREETPLGDPVRPGSLQSTFVWIGVISRSFQSSLPNGDGRMLQNRHGVGLGSHEAHAP